MPQEPPRQSSEDKTEYPYPLSQSGLKRTLRQNCCPPPECGFCYGLVVAQLNPPPKSFPQLHEIQLIAASTATHAIHLKQNTGSRTQKQADKNICHDMPP